MPCLDQEHISLHHGTHHLAKPRAGLTANLHDVENCLLKQSSKDHRPSMHRKKGHQPKARDEKESAEGYE